MQTIVWDVDDVLNDLMRAWYEQAWLPAHPQCAFRYAELTENPPQRLLGVSQEQYLASLDAFRLSERGRDLTPLPEVVAWFRQSGARFRHMALTATPLLSAPLSAGWVMRHFGVWIRSFHFIPSPRQGQSAPEYDQSKADFLRWFGHADVLVEDNLVQLEAARRLSMQTVLIPRPWNGSRQTIGDALMTLA